MRALVALALWLAAAPPGAQIDLARFRMVQEALTQAESPRRDWDPRQRDCAGFVRLLYRKAIGSPDALWRDRGGRAVAFVSAEELVAYNFSFLGREPEADGVATGDLLAFYCPEKPPADAWHLMVLLRPAGAVPGRLLVVWHNGSAGADAAVRKVWLDDLRAGPPEWRPSAANPRFLGTFRWNGWMPSRAQGVSP